MVVKSVQVDLSVSGDVESKAKLDALDAKAEELKRAFPTYALKIDSAAATSKLAVFRADFKTVADAVTKAQEVQVLSARATKTLDDIRVRADKLKATFPTMTATIDDSSFKAKLAVMAAEAKATGVLIDKELSGAGGAGGIPGFGGAASGGSGAGSAASAAPAGLSNPYVAAGAAGVALAAVPFLAQAAATSITIGLGGALTAIAILGASKTKSVQTSFDTLKTSAAADAVKIGTSFVGPLNSILTTAGTMLSELTPVFAGAAKTISGPFETFGNALVNTFGSPAVVGSINAVATAFGKILTSLSPSLAGDVDDIAIGVTNIANAVGKNPHAVTDFVSDLFKIAGGALDIISSLTRTANWIEAHWDVVKWIVAPVDEAIAEVVAHWATLQKGTETVFGAIGNVVLGAGIIIVRVAGGIVDSFESVIGSILHGLASAFGWIPGGVGSSLTAASRSFNAFHSNTDNVINGVVSNMQGWQRELTGAQNTAASTTSAISAHFAGVGVQADTVSGRVNALNTAFTRLPKNVAVSLTETGTGNFTITQGTSGHAGGTPTGGRPGAAAGLYVATGTGPTADDVLIRASKGELVVPTYIVASGLVDHLRGLIPGFAGGGSIGALAGQTAGFSNGFQSTMTAAMEAAMTAAMKTAVSTATAAMSAAAGGTAGAGVQQWKGTVLQALKLLGLPASLAADVLYQMQTESGGNATIVNRTDSNWLAGHPSVGLMQVIAGTFDTYAGPYRNTGPFEYGVSTNPLANIYAALNYGKHGAGFGSGAGQIGSGHGYAGGGLIGGSGSGGVASQGAAYLKGWHKSAGTVNAQIDHWTHQQHVDTILAGAAGLSKALHAKYAKAEAGDKKTLAGLTSERTVLRDWRTQLSGSDVSLNAWIAAAGKTPALKANVAGWRKQLAAQKAKIGNISAMLGLTGAQLAADAAAAKAAAAASAAAAAAVSAASTASGGAGTTAAAAAATAAAVPLTPAAALSLLTGGSGAMPSIPGLTGPGGGTGAFPWPGTGAFPPADGGAFPWPGPGGWGGDQGRPGMVTPGGGTGTSGAPDPLAAKLDQLIDEVRQLRGVAAAIPARTGQHVGAAVNGAAASASFSSRYH